MNKKYILGCLIIILLLLSGLIVYNYISKPDTEVPFINSHLHNGNNEYNLAVESLNNRNYNDSLRHCNESYKEYKLARESAERALNKSIRNQNTLLGDYFTYTTYEIDLKMDSAVQLYNGLQLVKSNPNMAYMDFTRSNQLMSNATFYSQKRSQLEEQNPDTFR